MTTSVEKTVNVQYYALLREERGADGETWLTAASNLRQLYGELKDKYKFSLPVERLQVAVNDEFRSWDSSVAEKDTVVFIPPVAGG